MSTSIVVPFAEHPSLKSQEDWNRAAREALNWSFALQGRGGYDLVEMVGAPCSQPQTGEFSLLRDGVILARTAEILGKRSLSLDPRARLRIYDLSHGPDGDYHKQDDKPETGAVLVLAMVPTQHICERDGHKPPDFHPEAYARSVHDCGDSAWYDLIEKKTKPDVIVSFGHPDAYITAGKVAARSRSYVQVSDVTDGDDLVHYLLNAEISAASILSDFHVVTQLAVRAEHVEALGFKQKNSYPAYLAKQRGKTFMREAAGKFARKCGLA